MNEIETIKNMRRLFPACPEQLNQPFTADAELINLAQGLYAFSLDEFSPQEDFFDDRDLKNLGRNLAVAVISDVLAVGCRPVFYMHSITAPYDNGQFAVEISQGIQEVLAGCGCGLLGGDLGRGATWRYCGLAAGQPMASKPLTRIIPPRPQKIWLTGGLGDGNVSAFSQITGGETPTTCAFELRLKEAQAMAGLATACIDTSGGLAEALMTLQMVNPACRFEIQPDLLPFEPKVRQYAEAMGLPLTGFALGGAGEYELLFTTDLDTEIDFAAPIGEVQPGAPGIYWNERRLPDSLPDPREFSDLKMYITALLGVIKSCRI